MVIQDQPDVGTRGLFSPSVILLVAANLVPLYGVFFLDWKVFPLIFLFWMENVIVGLFNVFRMLCSSPRDPLAWLGKLFMIPFFCVHYGMFTFVHGIFVMVLFGGVRQGSPDDILASAWAFIGEDGLSYAVLALALSHGASFALNYIGNREYLAAEAKDLMGAPYGRVVVLHIAIIGGGFLLAALRSPAAGLVLLVLLKIAMDVRAHLREHRAMSVKKEKGLPASDGAAKEGEAF